jgi:hypothetical protein
VCKQVCASSVFAKHELIYHSCKALVYAHEDHQRYGMVLTFTIGIVFLATPHRGSDSADFANVVLSIFNTCLSITTAGFRSGVSMDLLEYLGRNSKSLQDLLGSARHRLQNISIVSFYENRMTPPLSSLVGNIRNQGMSIWTIKDR